MDPDPDSDPDHSQNLIISSLYLFRHILKISSISIHKFLSYLVHKQRNSQTNPGKNITSLAEVTKFSKCNCFQVTADLLNRENLKVAFPRLCNELQVCNFTML